jgi:glycerophosphoryl diester phosphodiesterase
MTFVDQPSTRPIKVTGHRGAMALAPENTALSLLTAQRDGADELEIDIRLSADDVAVVVHDATLARICGDPERDSTLRDLAWDDIRAVELPRGQRVLTLAEVLELTSRPLQVEIKEVAAVAALAAELDRRPDDRRRCLVSSFSPASLGEVRSQLPDLPRGLIVKEYSSDVATRLENLEVGWLLSGWRGLDAQLVASLQHDGVSVGAWPVRGPADAARATELGVAAVTADDPGAARRWLNDVGP